MCSGVWQIDLSVGREAFIYLHIVQLILTFDGQRRASSQNQLAIILESWIPRARPMVPYALLQQQQ